jgi:hypothetical protein
VRTAGVKLLVEEVLASLPRPYSEDVIDNVFCAIERNPKWRQRYDDLSHELTKTVVNTWGGYWIGHAVGRTAQRHVTATSSLIESYSKL